MGSLRRWKEASLKDKTSGEGAGRREALLDNAMAESFVSTLKAELVDRHCFPARKAARVAIFEYAEGFYDRVRRHPSPGYESPSDYETATMEAKAA